MNNKERYHHRKANNLCVYCGKPRDHSGKSGMCLKCKDYVKNWTSKKRSSHRNEGLCSCGNTPLPDMKTCNDCLLRTEKRNNRLKETGTCFCGKDSEGYALCKGCRKKRRDNYHAVKDAVFYAYGGYECQCCGETIRAFLTIDHENNDGSAHRKALGRKNVYRWLKDNGFPPGFQVLCFNCNSGRQINGGVCPHKSVILLKNQD